MAVDPDTIITSEGDDGAKATKNKNRRGPGANQSLDGYQVNDEIYNTESHNFTDRRTGLREEDLHASWREVATACHATEGQDHE